MQRASINVVHQIDTLTMARQTGTGKIQGTPGDITFYRSRDGLMAKLKSAVSADRIATDPVYARTKENGEEFGIFDYFNNKL